MLVQEVKRKKKILLRYIPVYLILGITALTIIIPILWVFLQSLKTPGEFYGNPLNFPKQLAFINYVNAWTKSSIGNYFFNSVLITALALFFSLLICVPAAYVLSRFKFWGVSLIFALFSAGIFINVNYIVRPLFVMINEFGFLLGVRQLSNNQVVVSIVYAVNSCSFGIFLLSGYLRTLPKGYEEAAKIDGCGYFGTLFKIVLPLALPSIITVILFNFLSYWNEYLIAYVFMADARNFTIPIGLMSNRATDYREMELGRMYAGLIIAMLPTLILYCFVQDKLTKGMSIGGLKG